MLALLLVIAADCAVVAGVTLAANLSSSATSDTSEPPVSTITWVYNASSSVDSSANIHTNGSGSAYAFACQAASVSYIRASDEYYATKPSKTLPTYVESYSTTSDLWDIWTTDCDGIPHAHGTMPTAITTIWNSTTLTDYVSTASGTYAGISPSCEFVATDCASLLSSYSKEESAFEAFTSSYTPPFYMTHTPEQPLCTPVCTIPPSCMIFGDEVRLMYWPVTTTGADSCRTNGTTVSSNATGIHTLVTMGTTLTSPSVYISFHSLWATDRGCMTTIGTPLSGTIVALDPKSLSSAQGDHFGRMPASFNLADLNGFVTSAAYFQMQLYDWFPRLAIYDELYRPILWMPDQVLSMRPDWKSCNLSIYGVQDPPLPLHTEAQLTVPSADPTTSRTAVPAATPSRTTATTKSSSMVSKPQDTQAASTSRGNVSKDPQSQSGDPVKPNSPTPQADHTTARSKGSGGDPVGQTSSDPRATKPSIASGGGLGDSSDHSISDSQATKGSGFSGGSSGGSSDESGSGSQSNSDPHTTKASGTTGGSTGDPSDDPGSDNPSSSDSQGSGSSSSSGRGSDDSSKPSSGDSSSGGRIGDYIASMFGMTKGSDTSQSTDSASAPSHGASANSDADASWSAYASAKSGSTFAVIAGSTTLHPGDRATTFDGHTFSAASNGMVVDGTQTVLPGSSPTGVDDTAGSISFHASLDGSGSPVAIMGGVTLRVSSGDIATGGHTISMGTDGVIVDGSTMTVQGSSTGIISLSPVKTGSDASISFQASTDESGRPVAVVDGSTLHVSIGEVTKDGHIITVGTDGIVVDGSTVTVRSKTAGVITISASHNPAATKDSGTTTSSFTGEASRAWDTKWNLLFNIFVVVVVVA